MGSSFYGGNKNSFYGGSGFYGGGDFEPELTVIDKVPYVFRKTGGDIDVKKKIKQETIIGGTIAWNQGVPNGNFEDASGWVATVGTLTIADNVATLKYEGESVPGNARIAHSIRRLYANHIIMVSAQFRASVNTTSTGFLLYASDRPNLFTDLSSIPANTWVTVAKFIKPTVDYVSTSRVYVLPNWQNTRVGEIYEIKNVETFDLTQMFGTTIANYIYSLEQANAGDGVAWFRKLFPNDYYDYDVGTLWSVQTLVHRTVGFNAWDEEWEVGTISSTTGQNITGDAVRSKNYIPVIPGTTYYPRMPSSPSSLSIRLFFYDADKNFMSYTDKYVSNAATNAFSMSDDCGFMRFRLSGDYGTTYHNDICINLSWDGKRNGKYEAYQAWNYPLDDSLTLCGVPTLDENNKFNYNGDTYDSDGAVTRRYGMVDLGTLTWTANSSYGFYANITDAKKNTNNSIPGNLICSKFPTVSYNDALKIYASESKAPFVAWKRDNVTNRGVIAYDNASTTAAEFTTAMSGVYLVYELDTSTTETADSYTNPQIIDPYGTEEFIDASVEAETRDVAIPVGHETTYKVKGN